MPTQQEMSSFIQKIAPLIQQEAKRRGYQVVSPIIAQACVESNYGLSGLSAKYHNYFGLKCGSSWKGKSVNMKTKEEYTAGVLTTIKDNFRAYDSMEQGVAGYFDFINTKRYANLKTAKTPREYLQMIKDDGYATSSSYVSTNMNVLQKHDLTRYDSMTTYKPVTPAIVRDVIDGKYGTGNSRSLALRNEGYDPTEVQNKINELYKLSKELEPIKKKAGEYFDCVLKF